MFSNLGPLFKTTFRKAEANDARLNIPHEERDKGRKKREEEEQKPAPTQAWVDDTSVSISALRIFLIDFLKTIPRAPHKASAPEQQDPHASAERTPPESLSSRPPERSRPTNTQNAKAVRAYQAMAHQASADKPPPPPENRDKTGAEMIESKELRDIYALIDDLDTLIQRGVQDLRILKADSFVESLKNAVALKKSQT